MITFPLHDILLILGYRPRPDECIGQATIYKALAEHDKAVVADAIAQSCKDPKFVRERIDRGDKLEAENDTLREELAGCKAAIAACQPKEGV